MEKDKNDIEDLFKQSFDNYEPEVRPKVWKNIRVGLKWGGLAFLINAFINKIGTTTLVAVLASVAAVGVGSVMYFNRDNDRVAVVANAPETIENKGGQPIMDTSVNKDPLATTTASVPETVENTTITSKIETTEATPSEKIESLEMLANIAVSPTSGTAPLIVELANNGTGKTNKWIFDDGKTASTLVNPIHVFEAPGMYQILLTSKDAKGKQDTDTISVEVTGNAPVAKEFTPNGDGVTDVFVLQSKNIASMNAKIYDAAGLVVYKSEGTDTKWGGKDLQGKDAPEATYFYVVQAHGVDGKKYDVKGAVKLKR